MMKSRISQKEITKDIDEGLLYAKTDYFDLYYLHRDDESQSVSNIMDWLNIHIKSGKIRAIGCSNWKSKRIAEANLYCEKNGLIGFSASQIMYSLAEPNIGSITDPTILSITKEEYDFYSSSSMLLTSFSSQAKGFFTKLDRHEEINPSVKTMFESNVNRILLEEVKELAKYYHVSVTAVCLAYLYSQTFDCIPIIGCGSIEQLKDSLAFSDFELTKETVKHLNAIKQNYTF